MIFIDHCDATCDECGVKRETPTPYVAMAGSLMCHECVKKAHEQLQPMVWLEAKESFR